MPNSKYQMIVQGMICLFFCLCLTACHEENRIPWDDQNKIGLYLDEQQSDPERFGSRILDVEMAREQLKLTLDTAERVVADLKAQHASPSALQAAQEKQIQAKKAYLDKQQELDLLLGIAALGSPE